MNRSPLRWLTSGISQWDPDICHKISWKTSQASRLYSLLTESINHALVVIFEIIIVWTASCTSNELWNIHTIRRAKWYVAGKEWKIDNVEVKIITSVIYPGWKLASTVYDECEIKVVCQVIWFASFLNSQLGWIYLFEIIQKLLVIENNQIIYVSIA